MDSLRKRICRYIVLGGMVCVMLFGLVACGHSAEETGDVPPVDISEIADALAQSSTKVPAAENPSESVNESGAEATQAPTAEPTAVPTPEPTTAPTPEPTAVPTAEPTTAPTPAPTSEPPTVPISAPTPEIAICSALSVDGTGLVDESGNPVQLRGVSTHGLSWYPEYVNEECFRQLKEEWGANVVRLAMYTAEYGGYCTGGDKEALKSLINDGVEYATDLGLYVIIDWHILSDGNPNTYLQEAKDFFGEMAECYADYTNVLYEICNEPNGGTTWSQVKEYAEQVIPVIRKKDEDGIILVGTPNWCQYVDQAAADPITGYDNIMYTLHFYAATHTDSLRSNMVAALEAGLPLFVSEYGICDASGSGNIDTNQAEQWVKLMDEHQVSYVAWNLSNKAETSAFFKQDCNKLSGFTEDDLSASGKWVYETLREIREVPAEPNQVPATGNSAVTNSAGLTITLDLANSWKQGEQTCYQFALTITNNTAEAVEGWSVTVPFNQVIGFSSGWNGSYSAEGPNLIISSVDYNGHMDVAGSVGDIGFIVQSGENLEVLEQ